MSTPPTEPPNPELPSAPADPPTPLICSGAIHEWVKTLAIVGAGCWAIYTFVWKEILVPNWIPAAIVMEVSLTPVSKYVGGDVASRDGLMEMELQMSATNPSARTLYLLPNYWKLSAIQLQNSVGGTDFAARVNEAFSGSSVDHVERKSLLQTRPIIAAGRLFVDDLIQPQEKITRNLIVRVPTVYSAAMIELLLPALTKPPTKALLKGRTLVWSFHEQVGIRPMLCGAETLSQTVKNCNFSNLFTIDLQLKEFDRSSLVFTKSRQVPL
jgi:hypothetical protein